MESHLPNAYFSSFRRKCSYYKAKDSDIKKNLYINIKLFKKNWFVILLQIGLLSQTTRKGIMRVGKSAKANNAQKATNLILII